jgi:hypothetical protein
LFIEFCNWAIAHKLDLGEEDNDGDMPVASGRGSAPPTAPPATAGTRDLNFGAMAGGGGGGSYGALNTYGQMSIDWTAIHRKLPYERTPEAKAARRHLWEGCDINGNGYLSLAEVDKGLQDVLQIDQIFHAKPAIMRAFQLAKNWGGNAKKGSHAADYVQKKEFRILLQCLRHYFELWVMFEKIDTAGDRRIDLTEFSFALQKLVKWGLVVGEGGEKAVFETIDKNHGGQILFKEFCDWAIAHKLDLGEEDDDGVMPTATPAKAPATRDLDLVGRRQNAEPSR